MANEVIEISAGIIVEDGENISMAELCRRCTLSAERTISMIEYGVVEPLNPDEIVSRWRFPGDSVLRIQTVLRLERDLNINLEGAALALDLLDEIKALRQSVKYLKRY